MISLLDALPVLHTVRVFASRRAGAVATPAVVPSDLPRDARFRLRRWPPGALLQPPYRRTLADHLLMHETDVVALATHCKVPMVRCCEFVSDLRAA